MEWLKSFFKSNPVLSIGVPTAISAVTFLGHLAMALRDGVIDDVEFHQLMGSANGIETAILMALMFAVRNKGKKR